jgi:hypothetical protein
MKRLIWLGVLVGAIAVLVFPGAGSSTNPAGNGPAYMECLIGDVGCVFFAVDPQIPGTDMTCTPWYPQQPVTCSTYRPGLVTQTTVFTGVRCAFLWPLAEPLSDPPPPILAYWVSYHGTAIVQPGGQITVHCPPA